MNRVFISVWFFLTLTSELEATGFRKDLALGSFEHLGPVSVGAGKVWHTVSKFQGQDCDLTDSFENVKTF